MGFDAALFACMCITCRHTITCTSISRISRSHSVSRFDTSLISRSHFKNAVVGTHTGKAVLLEDIIYNLSCNSDHYKNATLSIAVGEMQHKPLFELFREHKVLELD